MHVVGAIDDLVGPFLDRCDVRVGERLEQHPRVTGEGVLLGVPVVVDEPVLDDADVRGGDAESLGRERVARHVGVRAGIEGVGRGGGERGDRESCGGSPADDAVGGHALSIHPLSFLDRSFVGVAYGAGPGSPVGGRLRRPSAAPTAQTPKNAPIPNSAIEVPIEERPVAA